MESNTPSPSPSSPSLASQSPLLASVSVVGGYAVSAFAISKISPMLASNCDDKRWMWGLGGVVVCAVPIAARLLPDLLRAALKR